jgi:hypothetical protein
MNFSCVEKQVFREPTSVEVQSYAFRRDKLAGTSRLKA